MSETKTKSGWRWPRRILIALAILATLIAIFYAEEDWRGKRAWENYKHKWEAKGEKFDWQAFAPPAVPDDENFFCASIFTNMRNGKLTMAPYVYGDDGGPDFPSYKNLPSDKIGYAGSYPERITDLEAWQNYYRTNHSAGAFTISPQPQTPAKDVLFALSKYDSAVEELRQASQRPYANVPLNYDNGFNSVSTLLPYLAELKRCTQLLQLRAVAELADGQNEKALDDVKLILYLNHSLRTSPFLIGYLVRIAIVAIDLQPIWEGLAKHEWSDEQLVAIDEELSNLDFLADYEFDERGELAFAIAQFENQQRTREIISFKPNGDGYITNKLTFMPSAFFYQNELAFARMQQEWILPLVDTNSRTVSPEKFRWANNADRAAMKHYSLYKVQALMLFPATGALVEKAAAIQSSIDLARVACALERYRLAHGNYPETLDALAPQFIKKVPHDIIGGPPSQNSDAASQPLHYRLEANDRFILYSVGWNEKDDGGVEKSPDEGDWVWQYPKK